ncbi:MAG: hypothetical protein WC628_09100 [Candidatus Omnitrophota bacterium]
MSIRKFEQRHRQELRDIAYDTALMGEPAGLFFDGKEIICDVLTLYFTDYEPQSCFVAEADFGLAGYLTGAKDKVAAEKLTFRKIFPRLLREAFHSGVFLKKKNFILLASILAGILKGQFIAPDFNREYPATMHINIKNGFRGLDIGSRLVSTFLEYLKYEDVRGVHLATMSDAAGTFFSQQGFKRLYCGKRSYFRHILHKDVPLYIYGKKL